MPVQLMTGWLAAQVFYVEFGKLMMRQPVFGTEFATFAPIALVPYILLLVFNAFNRVAAVRSANLLDYAQEHTA